MNTRQSRGKIFSFGLQHVLAMYAGAILVPLLVGRALGLNAEELAYLVAIDLLTCGIATLLQTLKSKHLGIGLPVILGSSFVALTPMISIGSQYGVPAIYGAINLSASFLLLSQERLLRLLGYPLFQRQLKIWEAEQIAQTSVLVRTCC
jgi:xanthine/uracil permease